MSLRKSTLITLFALLFVSTRASVISYGQSNIHLDLITPENGATVTNENLPLKIKATSEGQPLPWCRVKFYVNNLFIKTEFTDNEGYASILFHSLMMRKGVTIGM